ncbi:MAG: isocitrate/isopropylmalate dehydrogenase family protein [Candidatus Micrarchaeota archaeon]
MHKICVIPGDGTGPELMREAVRALEQLPAKLKFEYADAGYECYRRRGTPIPDETIRAAREADAVLFAAVTTPPAIPNYRSAIVALRKALDLYANVRPCKSYPNTRALRGDIDLTIIRENTEGMYSGIEERKGDTARSIRVITRKGSERIARFACEYALKNKKTKVAIVHKANILRETCGLFREAALAVAARYPKIKTEEVLVDAMAMRLIKHPQDFQVIVTTNLFGDILSDEAAQLVGGLGMTPSANIGARHALFEPTHGSSPKYAGKNVVNPCAMLLSSALMLEWLGETRSAVKLRRALLSVLSDGKTLTRDLGGRAGTSDMVDVMISRL